MNKVDAEIGSCKADAFIHQWKSLNSCPHITMVTYIVIVINILTLIILG